MGLMQEIFDKVYAAVVAQGKPAVNGDGNNPVCTYRGQDGTKCAVGHLLSDAQIEKYGIMNGTVMPASFPIELVNELMPGMPVAVAKDFMRKLQRAHDDAAFSKYNRVTVGDSFVKEYKQEMESLAQFDGLIVPSKDPV